MFLGLLAPASVAIGANFSNAQINGSTTIGGATQQGGFLALSSNIGNYNQTTLAVVPELNQSRIPADATLASRRRL